MFVAIVFAAFVVTALIVFFATAYAAAKSEVYGMPRKEMYWCHKPGHGQFQREHCLEVMGVPFCPQCWVDGINEAKKEAYK